MSVNSNHHWSESDDVVALYLTLYGTESLGRSLAQVIARLDIKKSSMKMRVSNFNGKLSNISKQSVRVREQYKTYKEPELRKIVCEILSRPVD